MPLKTLIIISGLMIGMLYGSNNNQIEIKKTTSKDFIVLKADKRNMNTKVSAPIKLRKGTGALATFIVTYNGFSSQAQTAFQYAVDIWANILTSTVPIRVEANWVALDPNVLGSASAGFIVRDFSSNAKPGTFYPSALAEKLYSSDITHADSADIKANFNSNFGHWYFGTDGNCPSGQYDFVSVVLHELCHGLGFQGSMDAEGGQGSWGFATGYPFVFDHFAEDGSGQKLLNTTLFPNPSATLANALTSNNIYFNGSFSSSINGFTPVKLYAPAIWEASSSYSHLNETTYPAGNLNSLMTPSLGAAEVIHNPGDVTLGIFEDIGWTTNLVINTTAIYPGDTDNNGTVNALDILPIGVYFLMQGVSRSEVSFVWGAKQSIVWDTDAATHADANGDGIIDEKDIIGIGVNWGRAHTKNSNSYVIDLDNSDLLMNHRKNFEMIYNSLSGESSEILEIKLLLNSIFNFGDPMPSSFSLEQNFPNPFNPSTNIRFVLPEKQKVSLNIINMLGQVVSEPVKGKLFDAGFHNFKFNASTLPNGIYVYTLVSEKYNQSRKMIILK